MAAVHEAFDEIITQHEQRLSDLQQKIDELNLELKGLTSAREVASGSSARSIDELISNSEKRLTKYKSKYSELTIELRGILIARDGLFATGKQISRAGRRPRRISDAWRSILGYVRNFGEAGANLNEINGFIRDQGFEIKEAAVRSQLSIYSNPDKGYLKALGSGSYQITELGCALLDRPNDDAD